MLFSSIIFLFTFLPITLLLYYIVPARIKNTILLLVSLVFYAWGEPIYIFLMIFSIFFNYICGLDIGRNLEDKRRARRSVIFTVVVNLCILGFFKYYGFLVENLNAVLPFQISYRELALPIGISFYTFQTLSYIIDVYRGDVKAQRNLLAFGTYVAMFPQLIAGPIVQYSDVERQLKERTVSLDKFGEGILFFIRGLSKKVLLANMIGMVYAKVTGLDMNQISVASAWLGCAAYTFQIYFDFSGYSDMAVGLGKMFGFEFKMNFDYPYISKSITEFWRRWHISLGSWFREYVYIPLGGNRVSIVKHIRNILIVWFLTGLWHGASWNFIVWGLYYGLILLIEKMVLKKVLEKIPSAVRSVYTMLLVMIGWVFFFSPDLTSAVNYLGIMFGAGKHVLVDKQSMYILFTNWGLWAAVIIGSMPVIHQLYQVVIYKRQHIKVVWNTVVYGVLFLLCIAYLVTETYNPFLYFRF